MFGFQSSEIFRKKTEFSNSRNFHEKFRKKVWKFKFRKKSVIIRKFQKKWCKIWGFRAKNPVFRSKSSEQFGKKLGNFGKKLGNFGNWFFRMFGNFGNFGNLEIPNFPKTSKKWRTIQTSEIRKYSFRLKNRPESSAKSSECRALFPILLYMHECM